MRSFERGIGERGCRRDIIAWKTAGAVEPKILRRGGLIDVDALREVKDIRKGRRELAKLIAECEREAEVQIAAVEATLVENLRQLDALKVMQ